MGFNSGFKGLMYELKKIRKVFTSKFVGTGPSSYEKRIYRATVSQRLRNTDLDTPCKQCEWIRCTMTSQISFNLITDKHQHVHFVTFTYDYIQHMLYTSMKFVDHEDGRTLWPKHEAAVNSTYWARSCKWVYVGQTHGRRKTTNLILTL